MGRECKRGRKKKGRKKKKGRVEIMVGATLGRLIPGAEGG